MALGRGLLPVLALSHGLLPVLALSRSLLPILALGRSLLPVLALLSILRLTLLRLLSVAAVLSCLSGLLALLHVALLLLTIRPGGRLQWVVTHTLDLGLLSSSSRHGSALHRLLRLELRLLPGARLALRPSVGGSCHGLGLLDLLLGLFLHT